MAGSLVLTHENTCQISSMFQPQVKGPHECFSSFFPTVSLFS